MASLSGTYRVTNVDTIANAIALIVAQMTVEEARFAVIAGGAASLYSGSLTLSILAEDGASVQFTHRITTTINATDNAAMDTWLGTLTTFGAALEAASVYTTVLSAGVTMSYTLSD